MIHSLLTKSFVAILFYSCAFRLAAQTDSISSSTLTPTEQTVDLLEDIRVLKLNESFANRYKMYPTENLYNLLKLDSQTGRIEQVPWSLDENKEFTSIIRIFRGKPV